jgi:SNF2 family DNA or RNA helicase
LQSNNIGCVKIVGETKDRMDMIQKFKNEDVIDVLLATTQTLSTGVTLTEASQMLFFGVPYRSADYNQACDRIHRIGQTQDLYIYTVLLNSEGNEKNITERINDIMRWSGDMFDSLITESEFDERIDMIY